MPRHNRQALRITNSRHARLLVKRGLLESSDCPSGLADRPSVAIRARAAAAADLNNAAINDRVWMEAESALRVDLPTTQLLSLNDLLRVDRRTINAYRVSCLHRIERAASCVPDITRRWSAFLGGEPVVLEVVRRLPTRRFFDSESLVAACKFFVDGLVSAGIGPLGLFLRLYPADAPHGLLSEGFLRQCRCL